MTSFNLTEHGARLGGDLRLRPARYTRNVHIWVSLIVHQMEYSLLKTRLNFKLTSGNSLGSNKLML